MSSIKSNLERVRNQIGYTTKRFNRPADSVKLLAVSKTRPAADILEALDAGQRLFGESYLQEALDKIAKLTGRGAEWHFIGRIQSNKTRSIAENFDWVHSIVKLKHAKRLNDQRPEHLPPLNICLQIMIDNETNKAGMPPEQAKELIEQINELPRLKLRGLMTLPAPADGFEAQRVPFQKLRQLRDQLATTATPLDILSMGMSSDLEAAIAEGASIVRVGTAIFGPRNVGSQ